MEFSALKIPVNDQYDWTKDPSEQADYVNPVTLSNKEVQYANAIIEVTGKLLSFNKQLGAAKLQQDKLKTKKKDMEADMLNADPPTKDASKNLIMLAAYLKESLENSDNFEEYKKVVTDLQEIEDRVVFLTVVIDSHRTLLNSIKMASENIQTALSFYKAEMKTVFK